MLRGISFKLLAGTSAAIIGPSGAGKTTLLNLLPRFFDPVSGAVLLEGVDLRDLRLEDLRAQIALVLQEPIILPTTVAENISYGKPQATMEEIEAAAHAAGAAQLIEKLPQHYRTVIGDGGARLSVGEKQRINLARAFLKDAPILLMDEPTSALDVESEAQVVASLFALMRGRTTLMVAHRLSTIRRVDKILVVDNGRLTEMGAPEDLARRAGLLRAGRRRPARALRPHRTPRSRSAAPRSLCWRSRSSAACSRSHLARSFSAASIRRAFSGRPDSGTRLAVPSASLDRPRQARIGALEALLQGRDGLAELLPFRPFRSPLADDDVEILALLSGHVDQCPRVTGRLLGGLGQAPGLAAALRGALDSGDPIPRDLVRALLLIGRNPALPCLDLGDPLGMSLQLVVVALTHVLPLAGAPVRGRDQREQKAGHQGVEPSSPGAAVAHRPPHLRLLTLPWMVSSRFASSLSCPARLSESWRKVSSSLTELADSS